MCRYSMVRYKPHLACFKCRKTFKRRLLWDINRNINSSTEAKCPQCSALMADMGKDFKSPKKESKKWEHLENLFSVGITFHSCGCSGPGFIPRDKQALLEYLSFRKEDAIKNLAYWRNRKEPVNAKDYEIDRRNNFSYLPAGWIQDSRKKQKIRNEDAINFWINRITEISDNIKRLN